MWISGVLFPGGVPGWYPRATPGRPDSYQPLSFSPRGILTNTLYFLFWCSFVTVGTVPETMLDRSGLQKMYTGARIPKKGWQELN